MQIAGGGIRSDLDLISPWSGPSELPRDEPQARPPVAGQRGQERRGETPSAGRIVPPQTQGDQLYKELGALERMRHVPQPLRERRFYLRPIRVRRARQAVCETQPTLRDLGRQRCPSSEVRHRLGRVRVIVAILAAEVGRRAPRRIPSLEAGKLSARFPLP